MNKNYPESKTSLVSTGKPKSMMTIVCLNHEQCIPELGRCQCCWTQPTGHACLGKTGTHAGPLSDMLHLASAFAVLVSRLKTTHMYTKRLALSREGVVEVGAMVVLLLARSQR